ncbi:hypothetical protein ACFYNF_08890 [Streptomyces sp. NPDC006641]|uniref:Uncharacterized protein n=1 Tax=Streptomyces sp. R08 TaxID=3238624 RepID=A0AB39MCC1_9ACTN
MDKCGECEKTFDIADARQEYNAEFGEGIDYDDQFPEGGMCGNCAASQTEGFMNHGNAILMMNGELDYDADHVEKYL